MLECSKPLAAVRDLEAHRRRPSTSARRQVRLIGRRIIVEPGLGSELWRERELRHYRFDCSSNARKESLKVSGHGDNAVSANRQYTDRRQSAG